MTSTTKDIKGTPVQGRETASDRAKRVQHTSQKAKIKAAAKKERAGK